MIKNTIISLFDYSGNWSKPWRENGFNVIQIDIKLGIDILTWNYQSIPKDSVYGILAACPCTDFCVSGSRWWKDKDADGRTEKSIQLVSKTIEIIHYFDPVFWVIENPVGRIKRLISEIGDVKYIFNPCDFAGYGFENDRYNKKTCLYGNFINPVKKHIEPLESIKNRIWQGKDANGKSYSWNSDECKTIRSITPLGFAYAFYEANKPKEAL